MRVLKYLNKVFHGTRHFKYSITIPPRVIVALDWEGKKLDYVVYKGFLILHEANGGINNFTSIEELDAKSV